MVENIGVIGAGAMGKGMVKNLCEAGLKVRVFDLSPDALKVVEDCGATTVESLENIAKGGLDLLLLSLPTSQAVEETLLGEKNLLDKMEEGSYIVDCSTIDPGLAIKIGEKADKKGVYFFDAPVSGGPGGADSGTLAIMLGGNKEALQEIDEFLNIIGENIFYIGENGMAQVLKICHNMVVAATTVSLSEAFITGAKWGLDAQTMADVIGKSVGRSGTLEIFGPTMLEETYEEPLFKLSHMYKDVKLYLEAIKNIDNPSLMGSLAYNIYSAAMQQGLQDNDHSVVNKVLEDFSALNK